MPLVYQELRKLAEAKLKNEKPGQTLQATALVHEAYMRLVDGRAASQQWDNSRHFFAAAAESMRRILIDRARAKASLKRGGDRERIQLEVAEPAILPMACDDLLGLDEALAKTGATASSQVGVGEAAVFRRLDRAPSRLGARDLDHHRGKRLGLREVVAAAGNVGRS